MCFGFSHGQENSWPLTPEERSHLRVYNRESLPGQRETQISLLSSATSMVSSFPSGLHKWLLPPQVVKEPSPGNKGWGIAHLSHIYLFLLYSPFFLYLGQPVKSKYINWFLWDMSWYIGVKKIVNKKCRPLTPFASISPFANRTVQ